MKYLFPFDKVSSYEKIIIYGYGKVGKSYVEQIEMLNYCKIVAIVDRLAKILDVPRYKVIEPQYIIEEEFDKIVIAIENQSLAQNVRHKLIASGVEWEKIIFLCRNLCEDGARKTYKINSGCDDEIIHIGIDEGGGLGDTVLVLPLLYRIKELWGRKVEISFISRYKEIFDYISCVDCAYRKSDKVFDIFMKNYHIPLIVYWDSDKIKRIAPLLHDYVISIIELRNKFLRGFDGDKLWHFARLMHKKRYNVCDFKGMLKVKEPTCALISTPKNEEQVLEKFHLRKYTYLAINRDVDIDSDMCNFKLWPDKKYNELVRMIKCKYSELSLVRVGFRTGKDKMTGLDDDLTGQTSLVELLVVLKYAKLLISSEGGLVHLNHFLGGKSVVVYGPTDEKYFGYDSDIICVARYPCRMPCQYISENTTCPIKSEVPKCMRNVTPKIVADKIDEFLRNE